MPPAQVQATLEVRHDPMAGADTCAWTARWPWAHQVITALDRRHPG
ncbi:hypothetical protein [Nonomuraea sp. LPB2021202275-12-8]